MEEKLRAFLMPYIGQGVLKKDKVLEEDVDSLVRFAGNDHVEQEIIDYGTAHPEVPFWDLFKLIPLPTPEELETMQREIDNEPDDED